MVEGSGVLFVAGESVLLLRRSEKVTEPGTWGVPGGTRKSDKAGAPMDLLESDLE